jgi:hypothetical protein
MPLVTSGISGGAFLTASVMKKTHHATNPMNATATKIQGRLEMDFGIMVLVNEIFGVE